MAQGGPGIPQNAIGATQRKLEVLRLLVEGNTTANVAAVMGISKATVINYCRDQMFRDQLRELNQELLKQIDSEILERFQNKTELIDELAAIALKEMKSMIQSPTTHPGIKAKLMTDVLDRHPEVSRTKKLDVTSRNLNLTGEDLLNAVQVAAEMEAGRQAREKEANETQPPTDPNSQQNLVRD